jgi:hypothetical protein
VAWRRRHGAADAASRREVVGNTPAGMTGVMRADSEKWNKVIADTGTKVE